MSGTVYVEPGTPFTGTVPVGEQLVVEINATSDNAEVFGTEFVENVRDVFEGEGAGTAMDNVVESGGGLSVDGFAIECTVDAGGTMTVQNYGSSSGDSVYGTERVFDYAQATNETVYAGGTIIGSGEGGVGSPTIAGGTVIMEAGSFIGDVTFAGSGGSLEVDASDVHDLEIFGFGSGDVIAVTDLSNASLVVSGDQVDYGGVMFDIPGASGDDLVIGAVNGLVGIESLCFLAGTAIMTPIGSRAIETLHAGDLVLTADGHALPVRWLGRQTIATRFADTLRTAPIRVRRDALGDGLPVRDLFVSPDHAMMVDSVFVQAGALVNGVSITREDRDLPESFVYYHVELADHSLILAEGVPAETFIDNVDRLAFDNWDEHAALDGAIAPMREMAHPRAKAHRQVPAALRAKLLARGCALAGNALAATA